MSLKILYLWQVIWVYTNKLILSDRWWNCENRFLYDKNNFKEKHYSFYYESISLTLYGWRLMTVRMLCLQMLPCVFDRIHISVRFEPCCRKTLSVSTWAPYMWYQNFKHIPVAFVGVCPKKRSNYSFMCIYNVLIIYTEMNMCIKEWMEMGLQLIITV